MDQVQDWSPKTSTGSSFQVSLPWQISWSWDTTDSVSVTTEGSQTYDNAKWTVDMRLWQLHLVNPCRFQPGTAWLSTGSLAAIDIQSEGLILYNDNWYPISQLHNDHDNIIYMEKGQDKTILFYSEKISSFPCIGIAVFENIRGQERRLLFYGSRSYNNESALIWDSQGTEIGIGKKPIRLVYGIFNDSRIDDISIYTTNNIYTDVNVNDTLCRKYPI